MKDPVLAVFVRTDLNMSRGKIAVQVGHAVCMSMLHPFTLELYPHVKEWIDNSQVKIVLAVNSHGDLNDIAEKCIINDVECRFIQDAGKTEVEPGTYTCLAVGILA